MFDRSATRPRTGLGHATVLVVLGIAVVSLSMLCASAVDVNAMLQPDQAAARAMGPVEIPHEWVWRGRAPISLESMYGNQPAPQQDWIRMHRHE